jgi:hypothetical protein
MHHEADARCGKRYPGKIISLFMQNARRYSSLFFYLDDIIVYVTCDPGTDSKKIPEISDKIQDLVGRLVVA